MSSISRGAWRKQVKGARVWSYVLELSSNPAVRGLVTEWQPTSIDSYSDAAFLVSVPLVALLLVRARAPLPRPLLLALGSFFAIGLLSVRGVYWWAMAVPVVIAGTNIGPEPAGRPDPTNVGNALLAGAIGVALLLQLGRWLPFRSPEPAPGELLTEAPTGITNALRATLSTGERVFNAQA